MNRFGIGIFVAISLLISAGCVEKSVVIKVKRDGSGVIHVRDFKQSAKLGLSFGGSKKAHSLEESEPDLPIESELSRVAKELGRGVSVQSVSEAKNDVGWSGFEAIFAFQSIDEVTIGKADQLLSLSTKQRNPKSKPDESEKMKDDLNFGNDLRFELKEGVLVVHQSTPQYGKASQTKSATKDPFANEPKAPAGSNITSSLMESFLVNALKDARIGVFIEMEGGIGHTNAIYHDETQVTLFKAVLGSLIEQKGKLERLRPLSANLQGEELRSASQEIVNAIDGFDLDMSEKLTIAFAAKENGS